MFPNTIKSETSDLMYSHIVNGTYNRLKKASYPQKIDT